MPTGYTAAIKDGISFEQYALGCARAFGACVTLRDERGGGEKIPDEFVPSDYHSKALRAARDELATVLTMTEEQRNEAAKNAWDDAERSRLAMLEERRKTRAAYEAMLAKVNAWKPPTPDHAGLHEFMRTQIELSINFDCGGTYGTQPTPRLNGAQWAAERIEQLNSSIQYHEKKHAAEVERAATRTAWVRALRSAL